MVYRIQREKVSEVKPIDAFVSYNKAKDMAKEKMIKAIKEL